MSCSKPFHRRFECDPFSPFPTEESRDVDGLEPMAIFPSQSSDFETVAMIRPFPPRRSHLTWAFRLLAVLSAFGAVGNDALTAEQSAAPESEPSEPSAPVEVERVTVGVYVNDVQALNLREHSYAMDVYLWFRWRDPDLNPAETVEMVNPNELWGHVADTLYDEPIELPSGERYQVLRVQGRFSRKFFFDDFPYDRQELVLELEDVVHETNRMVYVPDDEPVAINPRLVLPGFRLDPPRFEIEAFEYPTDFGDPRRTEPHRYSRVRVALPISRPIVTSTLKMLLPVLCVVLGASLMLLLKTTYVDARLGIGITSLLTVVAIQLAGNETMPNVDYLVLMDKIHLAAYVYVLGGLGVVLWTARRIERGDVTAAERFQRRSFAITSLGFLLAIGAMILQAAW